MIKTTKNLLIAVIVMAVTSLFTQQASANVFTQFKYYSLTKNLPPTSYKAYFATIDTGPYGSSTSGLRNYSTYVYITDAAVTPYFSNRVTLFGDFGISGSFTVTFSNQPSITSNFGAVIQGGTSHTVMTSVGGLNATTTINNYTISSNYIDGIPVTFYPYDIGIYY